MNNGAKDIQPILTPTGAPNLAAVSQAIAPKNVVTPTDAKRRRKITRVETSGTEAQVAKSARHAFEVGVHRYCKSAGLDTDDASSMLSILLMPAADGKIVVAAVREDGIEKKAILPLITGAIGGLLGGGYGAFKNWDKDLGWKERLKQGLMYGAGGAAVGATGGLALGALGGGAAAAGAGTAAAGAGTAAAGGGLLSTVGNLAMPAMVAYQIFGGGGGGGGGAAAEKGLSNSDLLRQSGGGSLAGKSPKELDKALKALGLDDEFQSGDISGIGKGKDRRFIRQKVDRSSWRRNQGALGTSIGDIEMQIESGSTPNFEVLRERLKGISGRDNELVGNALNRLESRTKMEAGVPPAQRSGGAFGFRDQQPAASGGGEAGGSAAASAAARQLEQDARSNDSSEAVAQGDVARNEQYARQTASSQSRGGSIPQAPARNEFGQQGADEQLMSRGKEYEKWRDNTIFNQKVDEQTSRRMTFPGSPDAVQRTSSPEGVAMPGSDRWKQQTATNTGQAPVSATPGGTMPAQPGGAAAATAAAGGGTDADLQAQLDSFQEQFRGDHGVDPGAVAQAERDTRPTAGAVPTMGGVAPPPGVPASAAPTTPSTGTPAAAPAAPAASKARIASTGAGVSAATGAAGAMGATGATGPASMAAAPSSLFGPSGSFMQRDLNAGGSTSGRAPRKPTESRAVS